MRVFSMYAEEAPLVDINMVCAKCICNRWPVSRLKKKTKSSIFISQIYLQNKLSNKLRKIKLKNMKEMPSPQ